MSFLPALPAPGLPVFTSYQAIKCEHFIIKEGFTRDSMTACFADNAGNAGQQLLQIEMQKHGISFRGNGGEVMRITIERHSMSPTVYRGMGPDGRELWTLRVKTHSFSANEYDFTVNSNRGSSRLQVEPNVMGQKRGILFNGQPVATMGEQQRQSMGSQGTETAFVGVWVERAKQSRGPKEEHVFVAAGMDILVALGVACVRVDEQRQKKKRDEQTAITAAIV